MSLLSIWDLAHHFLVANWALVLTCLISIIYWYSTRNFNYWTERGIECPSAVPFMGSYMSFSTPFPLLYKKYMAHCGKIFGVFNGQKPMLVIAEPELIKRILVKDFHLLRNRPASTASHRIYSLNLVAARDEEWKRIRSILTPMFTGLKLRKMESMMQSCVNSMISWFDQAGQSGATFEVRDPMGNFTMDVIAKCAFATETNAHNDRSNAFVQNAKSYFNFSFARFVGMLVLPKVVQRCLVDWKWKPLYLSAYDFFENLSKHLIRERKDSCGNVMHSDMLQLMINAVHDVDDLNRVYKDNIINNHKGDGHHVNAGKEEIEREQHEFSDIIGSKYLSEEEIMAQAMVFFLAGYETTSSSLSYCLYELALNQNVQSRLYGEIQAAKVADPQLSYQTLSQIDYLDAVISEAMRKHSPATLLIREVSAPEYHIPELKLTLTRGQAIIIPIHAIHHCEEYFPNASKYDPERFMPENRAKLVPYTYLPFGGGPRNCIGMRFSLIEIKLGIARILDQFQIVPAPNTTNKLDIKSGLIVLKTSPINLAVKTRVI